MRKIIIILMAAFLVTILGGCASINKPRPQPETKAADESQTKPRLSILPFSGFGDDVQEGDTIARLFSYDPQIMETFTVVPRTKQIANVIEEQKFQASGYTDSDTIAKIGEAANAEYVISGHIRSLGNTKKLVIATIINVKTLEQLAGDYKEYSKLGEIPFEIQAMAGNLIQARKQNTSKLPTLAVVPFSIETNDANEREAETLAQILAIEIGRTGKYAVLPRTAAAQTALKELDYQGTGRTADEGRSEAGKGTNAQYVVSGVVSGFGNRKNLEAFITNIKDGTQKTGQKENYAVLEDGFNLMVGFAKKLTR